MRIAEQLKSLRLAQSLSLEDLAAQIGMSRNHLWQLESGKTRNPTLRTIRKLSEFYGVSPHVLMTEE